MDGNPAGVPPALLDEQVISVGSAKQEHHSNERIVPKMETKHKHKNLWDYLYKLAPTAGFSDMPYGLTAVSTTAVRISLVTVESLMLHGVNAISEAFPT